MDYFFVCIDGTSSVTFLPYIGGNFVKVPFTSLPFYFVYNAFFIKGIHYT